MPLKYGSVCSGVEAASLAWEGLGWEPVFFSEIEKFPSAVLAERWPHVPNFGDMTKFKEWDVRPGSIDVFVGGTPCQSFSVAGLRGGLDDERGNLALVYARMVDYLRPRWFVWENVPGVLSSNGGRDFGSILGAFQELGYSFAYRVLDAQYFGVPQRRRRVFVVGHLGDWRGPAAVLFEPESLRRDSEASRKAREEVAGNTVKGVARCLTTGEGYRYCPETTNMIVSFAENSRGEVRLEGGDGSRTGAISHGGGKPGQGYPAVASNIGVRRLTPTECERLQGFPDGHTLIAYKGKPASDGPRYKAIGNSMAVPVMRWIGQRIAKYSVLS